MAFAFAGFFCKLLVMLNRIAQFLTIAMLCLPAHAEDELYTWQAVDPAKPAPTTAFTLQGKRVPANLADFKGKAVVLNFWATWCTPCVKELPTLAALQERYADKGLVVLAMSVDGQAFSTVENFLRKKNIAYPLLGHDPESQLFKPLQGTGLPLTYLLNRDGEMVYRFEGATDWLEMQHVPYINEALQTK